MRTVLTIVTLVTGFALSGRIFGQEPMTLRVDVALVTVDVEVTDANERLVTTLSKEDFQIREDGLLQEIRSFDSIDAPYNVLLLFDCSASTEPHWPFLVQAMNTFTRTLRPKDRIAIAQFGGEFKMLRTWFARTSASISVNVETRDPVCISTDFYGAVRQATEELKSVTGRKGVVILTDGVHVGIPFQKAAVSSPFARFVNSVDEPAFQSLLRFIAGRSVVLYFVAVDTDLNPRGDGTGDAGAFNPQDIYNKQQVRSRLEQLATATGGRVVFPDKPEDVVSLYERMARDLGKAYSLGYSPSNLQKDGTYRKIEVRVRDQSLRVRQSRDGYPAR
jgi:Ca-activated chloride channel family protein